MDATCAIQASIHVFSLVRKYVSRILGTYHFRAVFFLLYKRKNLDFSRFLREAPDRIRTGDLRITSASLYLLSHGSLLHNNK